MKRYVKVNEVPALLEKFNPQNEREFYFIKSNTIYCGKVSDIKVEMSGEMASFIVFFGYNESGNGKHICYVPDIFDTIELLFEHLKNTVIY